MGVCASRTPQSVTNLNQGDGMATEPEFISCDVMVCTLREVHTNVIECYGVYVREGLENTWTFLEWHDTCQYGDQDELLLAISRGVAQAVL